MELLDILTKYTNIDRAYRDLNLSYISLRYSCYNMRDDIISIARELMIHGVRLMRRRKITFKLYSDGTYAKITRNAAWLCRRYDDGDERCYSRVDDETMLRLMEVIVESLHDKFVFAKEIEELLDMYYELGRFIDKLRAFSYIADIDCPVHIHDAGIKRALLESVEASFVDGLRVKIVRDSIRERESYIDTYVGLSIAYNCYEKFMNVLGELEKTYSSFEMEAKKFRDKIDELEAFISTLKMLGDGNDNDEAW